MVVVINFLSERMLIYSVPYLCHFERFSSEISPFFHNAIVSDLAYFHLIISILHVF